ncbi:MAG TPA: hypothetical protein VL242_49815 [Sorangium sp.]|nr:hypothetical protein [Sorangium sp.]
MIFIAAHRVNTHKGEVGLNLYFYRRAAPPPTRSDGTIDVLRARDQPGELVALDTAIKPGGNRVSAFIDFVSVEDNPSVHDAQAFFDGVRSSLAGQRLPLVHANASFAVHCNADFALHARFPQEFDDLSDGILRLLRGLPSRPLRDSTPLVVRVEPVGDGVSFNLDDASARKVEQYKGADWGAGPVHISHRNMDDFERLVGGFVGQMAMIVTKLDEEELLRLGGVRYVDAGGRELARWPSRKNR